MTLDELEFTQTRAMLWYLPPDGEVEGVLFDGCDEVDRTKEEVYAGVPQRPRARIVYQDGDLEYKAKDVPIESLYPSREAAEAARAARVKPLT